jgi:hypothetical protein
MGKQQSSTPPIYRGADPEMTEWSRNVVLFLNQELLRLSGQLNEIEDQATANEIRFLAIEARLTAHGI